MRTARSPTVGCRSLRRRPSRRDSRCSSGERTPWAWAASGPAPERYTRRWEEMELRRVRAHVVSGLLAGGSSDGASAARAVAGSRTTAVPGLAASRNVWCLRVHDVSSTLDAVRVTARCGSRAAAPA